MADNNSRVNVVFVGAGAPSHDVYVSLVARSNYAAIQKDGVKLQTRSFGVYTFVPDAAFPSVSAAAAAPGQQGAKRDWHYIVVTTKALPDVSDDSDMITPLVGPKSCIILIQNGVGVEEPFRKRFPDTPIVSAVTVISAEQTSPGTIRQNRWTRVSIGPYTDGLGTGDAEVLRRGTASTEALTRWWTDLGGIRDVEPHDEVGLQTLRRHLLGVMHEIRDAVPRILGRPFPDSMAAPEKIIESTARNKGARPSMLLDWEGGKPLELEVILGNPVRIARERGVEMPRLQSLYALLRSAQQMRKGRETKEKL
ncbi:hypothetical protein G7Z17_g13084 [Cylindrodendrum hubeiense]|uniref:2-dehydropantoate 2-reductase n=1 Tax=Cylindrodendrum hubeiense TaxID=595255 RepID=A0A9P5GSV8_9HYPO|nr:hypothetical protein G7Z17_g13084 [Cylindrodendrum hubeiense]